MKITKENTNIIKEYYKKKRLFKYSENIKENAIKDKLKKYKTRR